MQFCLLWAVEGCPPSDAVLPPVGRLVVVLPVRQPCPLWAFLVSCPFRRQPCPVRGLWWVVLPVRQLCPLWDTTLMHITISALPLARLDCIEFNFQSCLPDYFTGFTFSLQPCQLPEYQFITLPLVRVPVYNTATCQSTSLQHCHLPEYQFTTLPLARVPVYNTATCQTLLH